MITKGYKFNRLALASYWQFDKDEQAQIQKSLEELVATPVGQWSGTKWQAKRLPNEPTYLVHLTDNLRAFVDVAEGQQPEVLDIVYQERLDFFAKLAANSAH